jgi:hypothetical protein
VRTLETQPRQHHTHLSVCKVLLRARASARYCAPAAPMLLSRRLCGWREHQHRNSIVTIITIDCVWLFSWRPKRLVPISHERDSNSIHHPTKLPCAPHKLVHAHDTQLRQHHTHISVCKVVLPARASARCCAPASPMLLLERLSGWCEQRDRNSMATIITIDCAWLFSRRPTRLALGPHWHPSRISATRIPFTTLPSCHVLHTSLCMHTTPSSDSITLTSASARSCCLPGPLQDAAPRHRRCCSR